MDSDSESWNTEAHVCFSLMFYVFERFSSYIPAILLVMNVFLLVTCLSTMQMAELYLKIMFISVFSDYCTHVSSCIICSPQVTLYFILMVS